MGAEVRMALTLRLPRAAVLTLGLATACGREAGSRARRELSAGTAGKRVGACSAGRTVDSAYVVRAAAEAVAAPTAAAALAPATYQAVVAPGRIEEGVLVRLHPRRHGQMGGDRKSVV